MNNISVEEAAKLLGITPMFLRMALQQKQVSFGFAAQMNGGRWRYHISGKLLNEYIKGERNGFSLH